MSLIITITILSYYKKKAAIFIKYIFLEEQFIEEIHTVNYFKKFLKK